LLLRSRLICVVSLIAGLFAFFCSLFAILTPQIVAFMASNPDTIQETVEYIRCLPVYKSIIHECAFLDIILRVLRLEVSV
jgi:hypothetical protein